MITLKNIKKVFKTEEIETWALQNVNLEVKKGEFVAIMGPSGCGKSTLLNILGLLDNPSEGTYMLDGKDVSHMSEDDRTDLRKGRLGFVFQSFNLIDELSVVENVELPLLYMGTPKKERRRLVNEVVERVAIARAVISRPQIILADEPTGNLDSKHGKEVMELLKELHNEGTTIIMVTHSQHDANYADRVVNLFDGEIVSEVEM